jgi:hypothetical protein
MGEARFPIDFGLMLVTTALPSPLCPMSYYHQTHCLEGRIPKW